jgi:Tol biopolymer transport system component/uncharacterized RDD family membrane protein YckC
MSERLEPDTRGGSVATRFNPAPGWPPAPAGFTPAPGWQPGPDWPPAPPDWPFWVPDEPAEPDDPAYRGASVPVTADDETRLAPHRRRLAAFGLDVLLVLVPFLVLVLAQRLLPLPDGSSRAALALALVALGLSLAVILGLSVWLSGGQTLGKAVLGLTERRLDGSAPAPTLRGLAWSLGRHSWGYLVVDMLGVGTVAALLTPRRQALHDLVFGSEVVLQPATAGLATSEQRLRAYSERLQAGLTFTRERYGWLSFLWGWYGKVILKTVPWVLAIAAALKLAGLAQGTTGTASTQTVVAPVALSAKAAAGMVAVTSVVTAALLVALTPGPSYRNTLVSVAFGIVGSESTREIYVLQADGDDLRQLTDNDAWDAHPDLFHDERIVFSSEREDGRRQLWTMGVDGSAPQRLTRSDGDDVEPDWSPDGERIVFVRQRDGDSALYVIDADGSDERRLSGGGASYDVAPDWSPDGETVAFARGVDGAYQIHTVDADGAGLRRLGAADGNDLMPRWSPDGEQIAFSSDRDGNWEVYVMAADGSDVERLTTDPAYDQSLSWSPDGDKILFRSGRGLDEGGEIWAMDRDGSDPERLTDLNEQGG